MYLILFFDHPTNLDKIVLIYSDEKTQIERIKERDGLSDEQIRNRLNNQISIEDKRNKSDFVVINSGSVAELKNQLVQVLSEI